MCICVWVGFSGRKTTATDRQMGRADGNGPAKRQKHWKEKGISQESSP